MRWHAALLQGPTRITFEFATDSLLLAREDGRRHRQVEVTVTLRDKGGLVDNYLQFRLVRVRDTRK